MARGTNVEDGERVARGEFVLYENSLLDCVPIAIGSWVRFFDYSFLIAHKKCFMLKNYLSLAFKNFRKQKMFSLINILGLTVGITCCLMIFLFVMNEFSYDTFHKNGKNIYRIMRVGEINGQKENIA